MASRKTKIFILEDLATVLRIHAPPPYLYYQKRPMSAYGQACPMDVEPFDGIQKKVKLGALGLDFSEALYDVERMGVSRKFRVKQKKLRCGCSAAS